MSGWINDHEPGLPPPHRPRLFPIGDDLGVGEDRPVPCYEECRARIGEGAGEYRPAGRAQVGGRTASIQHGARDGCVKGRHAAARPYPAARERGMQPVKDARGPRAAPIMTAASSPSETCEAAASMVPCRSPQHRLGAIRVRASRQHLYDRPRVKAAAPLFHGAWPRGSTQNSRSPRRPSRPTPHGLRPLRGPAFLGRRWIGIARYCDGARSIKGRSRCANFEQSPAYSRNTFRRCSLASLRPLAVRR